MMKCLDLDETWSEAKKTEYAQIYTRSLNDGTTEYAIVYFDDDGNLENFAMRWVE